MTSHPPQHQSAEEAASAASDAYEKKFHAGYPDGMTVASYCNAEVPAVCFDAGWDAAMAWQKSHLPPAQSAPQGEVPPRVWIARKDLEENATLIRVFTGELLPAIAARKLHTPYVPEALLSAAIADAREKGIKLGEEIGKERSAISYWEAKAGDNFATPGMQSFAIDCLADARKRLEALEARRKGDS